MEDLLQLLLETLVTAFAPILFTFLGVLAWKAYQTFRANLEARGLSDEWAFAMDLADRFVLAAQQNGLIGEIEDIGSEKKQWALDQLQRSLDSRNIHLDVDELSALLESAYHEYFKLPPES